MSTYRNLYPAIALTFIAALAGAFLNLAYFQGEYFPMGNFIMLGAIVAAPALCRLFSNTHFITTTVSIALSGAVGMISGIIAHSSVNSAPSLLTYEPSIYWQSLMISLVFSSIGALLGILGRLAKRKAIGGQRT